MDSAGRGVAGGEDDSSLLLLVLSFSRPLSQVKAAVTLYMH